MIPRYLSILFMTWYVFIVYYQCRRIQWRFHDIKCLHVRGISFSICNIKRDLLSQRQLYEFVCFNWLLSNLFLTTNVLGNVTERDRYNAKLPCFYFHLKFILISWFLTIILPILLINNISLNRRWEKIYLEFYGKSYIKPVMYCLL